MPRRKPKIDRSNIDEADPNAFSTRPKEASIFGRLGTPRPVSQATLADADAALYGSRTPELRVSIVNGQLRFNGFLCTDTGLIVSETSVNIDGSKWEEVGTLLLNLEVSLPWLIGDWLLYGEDLKYDSLNDIAMKLGYDPVRLRTYMAVCRNIEYPRRHAELSFKHHQVVARLPPTKQDFALQYAKGQYFSAYKFRQWLRTSNL